MKRARPKLGAMLAHGLFWSWNLIFFVFLAFGLGPWCLLPLLQETIKGGVPWDFTCVTMLLVAIPFASMAAAFVLVGRGPGPILRLFYGLQGPLLFLCLARLLLVRELNPGMTHLMLSSAVALTAYSYELFRGTAQRARVTATVQLVAHGVGLVVGVYAAALLIFYALPLGWVLLLTVTSRAFWFGVLYTMAHTYGTGLFFVIVGGALMLYSATLFVALPIAVVGLYCRSWRRVHNAFAGRFGRLPAWSISTATVAVSIALFAYCNRQPQRDAFALLAQPPVTDTARNSLLQQSQTIRAGLVNAYLAPYRYVSAVGENTHIIELYQRTLSVSDETARALQGFHNSLARPLLYDGARMNADQGRAEQLYEQFFDQPIQKAEQAAILHAIDATYDRDEAEAGLLNRGRRRVWVEQQETVVREMDDWAEVEIHEVYENRTLEQQEVFYYFTLPSTAVVTGLWLGENSDRGQRHAFVVAPRGAAQEVYRNEVRRRLDPSLLEQVGPRQYRLRAFPIPPRPDNLRPAPRVHLWFTFKVLVQGGHWPLPALVERRNVYWDDDTARSLNGQPAPRCGDRWMCPSVAAPDHIAPLAHQSIVAEGWAVRATPHLAKDQPLPSGNVIAVVLDRSASMARHAEAVESTFAWLQHDVAVANRLDVYLTAAATRGEPAAVQDVASVDARQAVYFGGQKTADLLRQFDELRNGRRYDAILVLTDDGGFDLAAERETSLRLDTPLWMVHLGGTLPAGYDDAVLDAIEKRGGGIATNAQDALQALARRGDATQHIADGYHWSVEPATLPVESADGFAQLAARQLIGARTRSIDGNDPVLLDELQAVAARNAIVSPYSSMIVLVNAAQREALDAAQRRADRFERETETGKEVLSRPFNPFAIGSATAHATPEPHEWLLLGAATVMLLYARRFSIVATARR